MKFDKDIWGGPMHHLSSPLNEWEYHWKSGLDEFETPKVAIRRFEVNEHGAAMHNIRCVFDGMPELQIRSGKYTKLLMHDPEIGCRTTMMSDTPSEFNDHLPLFERVFEDAPDGCTILINGLGMGCALNVLLHMDKVKHIVVIEKDSTVFDRIGRYYMDAAGHRLQVIHHDAFEFELASTDHFDVVWHDIWFTISDKNLDQMEALQAKYEDHCDWQGCWSLDHIETAKARGLWTTRPTTKPTTKPTTTL